MLMEKTQLWAEFLVMIGGEQYMKDLEGREARYANRIKQALQDLTAKRDELQVRQLSREY